MAVTGVVNAASGTTTLAPGTWAAVYGSNLASSTAVAQSVPFPTTLGGVQVTVGGKAAPLSYVSPTQINLLIPFELGPLNPGVTVSANLVIATGTFAGSPISLFLTRSAPAIFTLNSQGTGPALAFDQNFQPVSAVGTGPIVIYATGMGPTNPPASSSAVGATSEPLNRLLDAVSVQVGGVGVSPSYAGLAPYLDGIYQINFTPPAAQPGSLAVAVDGTQSNLTTLLTPVGANTINVSGVIDGLYPATGQYVAAFGGSSSPITLSAMFFGAIFQASFDIPPGALPFQVLARGPGGGATINFNPAARTYTGSAVVPTVSAQQYNFSTAAFSVTDFLNCFGNQCTPFPANIVPRSRWDAVAAAALQMFPLPTTGGSGPNGSVALSGVIPASGHVVIGMPYGGFVNLAHNPGPATATFDLYVDGVPVASKTVAYTVE